MTWDLGIGGLAVLLGMSAVAAAVARVLWHGRFSWRSWGLTSAAFAVWCLFVSEGWFGWATQEELQPNIDGLSFDEVLLLGCLTPLVLVVVVRLVLQRRASRVRTGSRPR